MACRRREDLDHTSLMTIRESRARARTEPDAEIGTECCGDRDECLHARVGDPGLDPGIVRPIDPREVGDLALGRAGIGPHPQHITAYRTNGLAVSVSDHPLDPGATIRRWHRTIEPDRAYLPIISNGRRAASGRRQGGGWQSTLEHRKAHLGPPIDWCWAVGDRQSRDRVEARGKDGRKGSIGVSMARC